MRTFALLFLQGVALGALCGVLVPEQPKSAIITVAALVILRTQAELGGRS